MEILGKRIEITGLMVRENNMHLNKQSSTQIISASTLKQLSLLNLIPQNSWELRFPVFSHVYISGQDKCAAGFCIQTWLTRATMRPKA